MSDENILETFAFPKLRGDDATLVAELKLDEKQQLIIRLDTNTKSGFFDTKWFTVSELLSYLPDSKEKFSSNKVWQSLFKGKNRNNAVFLMAALREKGLVEEDEVEGCTKKTPFDMFHKRTDKSLEDLMKELGCL